MTLENFGRNVGFTPSHILTPRDRNDVLACLEQHRGGQVRAIGRLHSWSDAIVCRDVILDLRQLDRVELTVERDGRVFVEIEAGCTIDKALDHLRSHGGYTLPTYGMIGGQTIAGATATGTHGSGCASLSHYVSAITVAAFDPSGTPRIFEWSSGDQLRAARCGLGCTGIVLSVRMQVERDYLIEEQTRWFDRIEEILALERDFPRQQCYLIPWSWRWYAQLRRALPPASPAAPSASAMAQRLLRRVGVDVLMNGALRLLAGTFRWWAGLRWFYRRIFPLLAQSGMNVTDRAPHVLKMRHDLYRHVEMELLVPARHIVSAVAFVEWVLRWCGGESPEMPDAVSRQIFGRGLIEGVQSLQGSYVHDHAITVRRVLADDTLISMTSGGESDAWYSISLTTYQRDRAPFLRMSEVVAAALASAYGARPHWGKVCPLSTAEIAALYPELPRFRAVCASVDPGQVFLNDFTRRALGF